MRRKSQPTRDEIWKCPGCEAWYPSGAEDTDDDGVCDACYEQAIQTALNVAAEVLESPGSRGTLTSREVRLPYERVPLPSLSTDDALTVVDILDRIVTAIWKTHGHDMADLQALRGVETPRPPDAEWVCTNPDARDDDEVF